MSTLTTYYSLVKPNGAAGGDFVDVTQLDDNFDTIDTALHNHDTHLTTLDAGPILKYAKLELAANATTTNNVNFDIPWTTEIEDASGFHAANSTDIVVPAGSAGLYSISVPLSFAVNSSGYRWGTLFLNGTSICSDDTPGNGLTGGTPTSLNLNTIERLAVADVLKVRVAQDSGGNLDLLATACSFKIARLGS